MPLREPQSNPVQCKVITLNQTLLGILDTGCWSAGVRSRTSRDLWHNFLGGRHGSTGPEGPAARTAGTRRTWGRRSKPGKLPARSRTPPLTRRWRSRWSATAPCPGPRSTLLLLLLEIEHDVDQVSFTAPAFITQRQGPGFKPLQIF